MKKSFYLPNFPGAFFAAPVVFFSLGFVSAFAFLQNKKASVRSSKRCYVLSKRLQD